MLARAECRTWNQRHVHFFEQPFGERCGILHAGLFQSTAHIRINVECAFRLDALYTGNGSQSGDDLFPPPRILGEHRLYGLLWPRSASTAAFCAMEVGFEVE